MGKFLDWLAKLFKDRSPGPMSYAYTDQVRNDLATIIEELQEINAKLDHLIDEHKK